MLRPNDRCLLQVFRGQNKFATLRLSLDRLAIRKPFNLQREKFGLRLNATAATTFDGAMRASCTIVPTLLHVPHIS